MPITFSDVQAGNHNDLYDIRAQVRSLFRSVLNVGLTLAKSILTADKGFDSKDIRNVCYRFGLRPNIKENIRNRKKNKRGRKRFYDEDIYKTRFINERTFAWMDSYRTILIRFDTTVESWINWHYIVAFLILAKV